MRVLVVDDEAPARRRLLRLLAELPDVEVVGEAGDVDAAMRAVEAHRPELLLLDIGMPGMDGLTWVARYAGLPPVVFTTAHDDRALEAFEVHAVDYGRARLRLAEPQAPAALEALTTGAPTSLGTRVVVNDRGATRFFDAAEITRFWSSEKYTLFVAEGREQLTAEPLTALESRLAAYGFVRVHRGELVAVPRIRTLSTTDGIAEVELADGQRARVSRRYLGALKAALGLAGD